MGNEQHLNKTATHQTEQNKDLEEKEMQKYK